MTQEMLSLAKDQIRDQYVNHEITPDQFASLSEDIALAERRVTR